MNKIKINLDRPSISSSDIKSKMNFEDILVNQKIMAKPFYKNTWFYGVTGIASVTLIAGSMYALLPEGDVLTKNELFTESVPDNSLKVPDVKNDVVEIEERKEINDKNKNSPIANKLTINKATNQKPSQTTEQLINSTNEVVEDVIEEEVVDMETKAFSFMDLYPRISGKINGGITKKELLNDQGLVTNSNVKIVSFQLHLVNGTGGEVYESNGNTLNSEMKSAINTINVGEEIYFEQINGQANSGEIVRLSPLRYVLLN